MQHSGYPVAGASHGLTALVGAIALALLLLGILQVVRFAWRFFHENEQMEAGGSFGSQLFGRWRHKDR